MGSNLSLLAARAKGERASCERGGKRSLTALHGPRDRRFTACLWGFVKLDIGSPFQISSEISR